MKNKKAFTLVELLAVIVLLGVILLIAVPSVTKISEVSQEKQIEEDANIFKSLVRSRIIKDTSIEISSSKKFTLNSIKEKMLSGTYDKDYSYVEVSGCNYTNDVYGCSTYKVYLKSKDKSYGWEDGTYKKIYTREKHKCGENEFC